MRRFKGKVEEPRKASPRSDEPYIGLGVGGTDLPQPTTTDFEDSLADSSWESLACLALANLLLRDSEGDGEAGAIALELQRRAKEI